MYDVNEMKDDVKAELPDRRSDKQKKILADKIKHKNTQHPSEGVCEIEEPQGDRRERIDTDWEP